MNCPHCNTPNPDDARFCASCGKASSATEPSNPGLHGTPPTPDPIGKEIAGRYRIVAKLGEGGMGAVYKAEQISLKRTCAVKLLRPDVASTEVMRRRFNAEAEAVAKLNHPNIVGIYDYGQDADGSFFIAMEFVEGKSLREVIHNEAPLPLRRALAIASQVAASLVEAHSQSIIHRDLKPDNVMLQNRGRSRDIARVLDFGIAKLRDEGRATQAAMTQAGDMLGTPQYMAPEQIRAEQIDGRTDVYALGCMLYEMITGRLPFEAPTLMALLSKHLMETTPPPSQRRPDLNLPPAIDELVMSALAKSPAERPPTMELYGEKINAVLAMLPPDPNASVQQSAVHGVPGVVTPQPGGYPTPGQAAFAPQTPPPQGFAPQVPPPGYPSPAPGGYGPPPGYGTPQTPYSPYPTPPPGPMTQPVPSGGGGKTILFVVLGVVVLAAAGVGIFFATKGSSKDPDVVATTGDAGTAEPATADAANVITTIDAAAEKDPDDPDSPDDPDDPDDPDSGSADPWTGSNGGGSNGALSGKQFITKMEEFKNRVCACADAACITQVSQEMQKWSLDIAKNMDMSDLDEASTERMTELGQEFATCATNVSLKGSTVKRPDPPPQRPLDLNAEFDRMADRACACRRPACGRRVLNDFVAFILKHKNTPGGDADRANKSGRRLGECLITKAGMDVTELQTALQAIQ